MCLRRRNHGKTAYEGRARRTHGKQPLSAAIVYHGAVQTDSANAIVPTDPDFITRSRDPEQPSLFPTAELVVPESVRNMRKGVSVIHAVPTSADHSQTLNGRRIFDACVLVAQLDFRTRGREQVERIRTERISPMFETRVALIAELANIPGKNYERIYEELDKLYDTTFRWNIVGEDATIEFDMKARFFSELGFGQNLKRGLVRFAIPPTVLDIVLEPSNWATLSLKVAERLKTSASYALYQNAWRYVNTRQKVTAALPTATWIELLVGPSRFLEGGENGSQRVVNYGDFKRRVLLDAIQRVNEVPALSYTLELKELRAGTRVAKLQFKFVPKANATPGLPLTWPTDLLQFLDGIGFSNHEVENISQHHSFETVADSIVRLKDMENRKRAVNQSITSRKAYFLGILENVAQGGSDNDLDAEAIDATVKAEEAVRADEARKERQQQAFQKHQADRFAANLFLLDDVVREELLARFGETPAGKSARVLLEKGGWSPRNVGALTILRRWLAAEAPEVLDELLPQPEDKTVEAFMAWRLDQLEPGA